MRPRKVRLSELNADFPTLTIYCSNHSVPYGGCHHSANMTVADAVARWGAHRRLDEFPLYCSRCGSRAYDVRANQVHVSQGPFDPTKYFKQ